MTDQNQKAKPLPLSRRTQVKPAKLTDRQVEILAFIDDGCREDALNRSASLRKIAARFGIACTTTWEHIEALKRKGVLSGEPDQAHSLELTPLGQITVDAWREARRDSDH